MPNKSTQSPSVNPSGYGSNLLDRQDQQNSGVTTPVKRPGMIQHSSDSRRSIAQPFNIINKNPPQKQKNVPSDYETKSKITPIYSTRKGKKKTKNPPTFSQSTLAGSSQFINLAQDSDEENTKVKHKHQRRIFTGSGFPPVG
ncbi:hypothetical protein VP01_5219g3 [Puccinia sorghi]|uniref:Uncharacterized protein n=1 Tax=Puccinia sorghi TaxID=27349 RepID=A0A0L6UML8_9BASI|nr:hypothetical protein VP01_5219g3 [Puccinia sorghi]